MKPIDSEADLDVLERGAKALAVMAAWNEAGLFGALATGPRLLSDLPGERRALRATAAVLRHLGLLVGDDTTVALSPAARRLVEGGAMPASTCFGTLADLVHTPTVLASGVPVRRTDGGVTADVEATRCFLERLHRRSAESVADTLTWTLGLLSHASRVLDLGGGHGRYAASYADAGHRATIMDRPDVVPLARERYGDHIAYLEGDFLQPDSLGGPYDLALASNIIHSLSPDENLRLLCNVASSLRPGGYVVLKDFFLDPSGRFDERAAFFGMTMLFYTEGGAVYTHSEVKSWLVEAGYHPPDIVVLDSFDLLIARRVQI